MRLNRLKLCCGIFWVALSIYLASQLVSPVQPEVNRHAIDFRMRYNEAVCVKDGKDPFLMWNGSLPLGDYVAWDFSLAMAEENTKFIHAYPPWEYAWMLPLTMFRQAVAEKIFWALCWCGLSLLCLIAFLLGYQQRPGELWAGFAAMSSVLLLNRAMDACLLCQNYGILITAAALIAIMCHQLGRHSLAGLFWSFVLVKPQIGALFFVPLVIRGHWRTIFISGVITFLGAMISSILCGRSLIDMTLAVFQYSQGQFHATGLIPGPLYRSLQNHCGDAFLMLGSAVVGLGVCAWLGFIMRPCMDVFEWILPSVFLSTLWTASRLHDQTVYAILFLTLALSLLRGDHRRVMIYDIVLILFIVLGDLDDTLIMPVNIFRISSLAILILRSLEIRRAVVSQDDGGDKVLD